MTTPRRPASGALDSAESAAAQLHFDIRLAARVPHLLRLARGRGLDDASAEDAVQDTLVLAWRHREQLRQPARFDAWLDQICRNAARAIHRDSARRIVHEMESGVAEDGPDALERIADEFDPTEALERADFAVLVDRLLGALPPPTRHLVELCYLAELPQREAALRLGLSLSAVEARLHRARRELRRLLQREFRADAQGFGLDLGSDPAGWRDTRQWCRSCGRVRVQGIFEYMTGGRVNLRLRCSSCGFQVNSGGAVPLPGRSSFRPALRHFYAWASAYLIGSASGGSTTRPCPRCGRSCGIRLVQPDDLTARRYGWRGLTLVVECRACDMIVNSTLGLVAWPHPEAQAFMRDHARWVSEPESLVTYAGRPSVRIPARDNAGTAHLVFFADPKTLEVLGTALN